jgi:hypothetical protein
MDRWKEMDKITFEITCLEILYFRVSEENRALITFPQYVAFRNPSWSEEDILHGIIIVEATRWLEEQRSPTPIRSMQPCYSCKGSWEPDHRCKDKDQKQSIEAHYDNGDDMSEYGAIDDDSDSCTKASDSDSYTEDDATSMIEDDYNPCIVDR